MSQANPKTASIEKRASGAASFSTQLERYAGLMLRNRFLWLAAGLSFFLMLQLSIIQRRLERFNTLDLISHIAVFLEAGLLACALINILAVPRLREASLRRWPTERFNHGAAYLASMLVLTILLVIELLPMLWLHRYPGLIEQHIHIPLMLLQRALLLLLAVLTTGNLVICLRIYLRVPPLICALAGIAIEIGIGYYITWLSLETETFRRLNSIFYYNQLWHYIDKFPNLQRPEVVHNIEGSMFSFYASALFIVIFTTLLWLPKASQLTAREKI